MASETRLKLAVLGSARVGKTCLIRRYLNGSFSDRYKPTREDIYSRDLTVKDNTYPLDIVDVGGSSPRDPVIPTASAFMILFALDDRPSFETAMNLVQEISDKRRNDMKDVAIIIVGNKCELKTKAVDFTSVEKRLFSFEWRNNMAYHEASAKEDTNVITAFTSLARIAIPLVSVHQLAFQARRLSLAFTAGSGQRRRSSLKPPEMEDAVDDRSDNDDSGAPGLGLVRKASRRLSQRLKDMTGENITNSDCVVS